MTDIVTSIFNATFWVIAVLFTLFVFGSTTTCVIISLKNWDTYNWSQLLLIGLYSTVLIYFYINIAVNSFIRIVLSHDGFEINYLLTKKQIVIDYADITNVSNVRITQNQLPSFNYLKLKIKLSTGEEFSFTENQFSNYDELKKAISKFRFTSN